MHLIEIWNDSANGEYPDAKIPASRIEEVALNAERGATNPHRVRWSITGDDGRTVGRTGYTSDQQLRLMQFTAAMRNAHFVPAKNRETVKGRVISGWMLGNDGSRVAVCPPQDQEDAPFYLSLPGEEAQDFTDDLGPQETGSYEYECRTQTEMKIRRSLRTHNGNSHGSAVGDSYKEAPT